MNYLQAATVEANDKFKSRLLKLLLFVNFLAVILTFSLNFLGLPILKYHYLIHIFIAIVAIALFDFFQIFPIILTLFFLEGQGRIIWEYENWSRIIFDSLVFIAVIKIFITKKKIVDFDKIPIPLIIIISLHFLWYAVEFSNLYSVSTFATLAATKVYLYPILLFLGLSQIDFNIYQVDFQKNLNFFIFLIVLELTLTFYQFNMKENFLIHISPYYMKAMKDAIFTGKFFRPFGTSYLPGAISAYFWVTVGFLFLKSKSKLGAILRTVLIGATSYAFILCQVRSAFIKFLLIILAIHIGELIYFRFRIKSLAGTILILLILFFGNQYIANDKSPSADVGIDHARNRMLALNDVDKMKSSRLDTDGFVKMATTKLMDYPLGLGPGLTGPAGGMSREALVGNRFINLDMLWSGDNLFVSLIIDFGIGAIFYILMLFYIPSYFMSFLYTYYKNKAYEPFKILLVCFSSILVIIFGNWGAVGITYNPESFAFWFFVALGFSTIAKFKKIQKNSVHVQTDNVLGTSN
jgi:hypothetical protein